MCWRESEPWGAVLGTTLMLQTIVVTSENATEKAMLTAGKLRRIGSWSSIWVDGGTFWVEGESQCQGLRPGTGARLLSWRELGSYRECLLAVERKEHCVCSGSGLEEALFRTCSPCGLPGILSEEAVLMVSFLLFFFLPLPLCFLIFHLPVLFLLLLPPFLRWPF